MPLTSLPGDIDKQMPKNNRYLISTAESPIYSMIGAERARSCYNSSWTVGVIKMVENSNSTSNSHALKRLEGSQTYKP